MTRRGGTADLPLHHGFVLADDGSWVVVQQEAAA